MGAFEIRITIHGRGVLDLRKSRYSVLLRKEVLHV